VSVRTRIHECRRAGSGCRRELRIVVQHAGPASGPPTPWWICRRRGTGHGGDRDRPGPGSDGLAGGELSGSQSTRWPPPVTGTGTAPRGRSRIVGMRRYWRIWSAPTGTTTGRSPGTLTWRRRCGCWPGRTSRSSGDGSGRSTRCARRCRSTTGRPRRVRHRPAAGDAIAVLALASTPDAGRAPPRAKIASGLRRAGRQRGIDPGVARSPLRCALTTCTPRPPSLPPPGRRPAPRSGSSPPIPPRSPSSRQRYRSIFSSTRTRRSSAPCSRHPHQDQSSWV
jgi:hypothetical protein